MPVFRITIEKSSPVNARFTNVYYALRADFAEASSTVALIAACERKFHGSTVQFENGHIDQLGSNAFTNVPLTGNGLVTASLPTKSQIIARITWGVDGSYPHYKDYRVGLEADNMVGVFWTTGTILALQEGADLFNSTLVDILCTKGGVTLGEAVISNEYFFRNENNKWHNRG